MLVLLKSFDFPPHEYGLIVRTHMRCCPSPSSCSLSYFYFAADKKRVVCSLGCFSLSPIIVSFELFAVWYVSGLPSLVYYWFWFAGLHYRAIDLFRYIFRARMLVWLQFSTWFAKARNVLGESLLEINKILNTFYNRIRQCYCYEIELLAVDV